MDEAYACEGENHWCPLTRAQLRAVKDAGNIADYDKMNSFNFILCSGRITIERAFGMLVMKWAILQLPLRCDLQTNCDILMTCVKLHNLCIDDWIEHDRKHNDYHFQRSFMGEVEEMGTSNVNFDALRNPYPNSVFSRACAGSEE